MGLADKTGIIEEDGTIPHVKEAMMSDAIGTTCGAMLGSSTLTTYVESASGIAEARKIGRHVFSCRLSVSDIPTPLTHIPADSKCSNQRCVGDGWRFDD